MKQAILFICLWALCGQALCSVFAKDDPEAEATATDGGVATITDAGGVSFEKEGQEKKEQEEGVTNETKSGEEATEEEVTYEDEAVEVEVDDNGDINVIPENLTCRLTAHEQILRVFYNKVDITHTIQPYDFLSQWSAPKMMVSIPLAPKAVLSVVTAHSTLCPAFAISCKYLEQVQSDLATWETLHLRSHSICAQPHLRWTSANCTYCCGDDAGFEWNKTSAVECAVSDSKQSGFTLDGPHAKMGAAAPVAIFRWPKKDKGSGATITTCDILTSGTTLQQAWYESGNVSFRTLNPHAACSGGTCSGAGAATIYRTNLHLSSFHKQHNNLTLKFAYAAGGGSTCGTYALLWCSGLPITSATTIQWTDGTALNPWKDAAGGCGPTPPFNSNANIALEWGFPYSSGYSVVQVWPRGTPSGNIYYSFQLQG